MNATGATDAAQSHCQSPKPTRDCGDCIACCKTMFVRDLKKPAGVPCKFLTPHGCGVYEHRWDVCKGFVCMWLRDHTGLFAEEHRPDQLGLILTGTTDPLTQQMQFTAHEVWPLAAASVQANRVVAFLQQFGPVKIVPAAQPKNIIHNISLTVDGKIVETSVA